MSKHQRCTPYTVDVNDAGCGSVVVVVGSADLPSLLALSRWRLQAAIAILAAVVIGIDSTASSSISFSASGSAIRYLNYDLSDSSSSC